MKPFKLDEYIQNPSRKVVTRDGKPVRIICTDVKDKYPIVGIVDLGDNSEDTYTFTQDGMYLESCEGERDLFFSPEKREGWVNVYLVNDARTGCSFEAGAIYNTKEEALKDKLSKCCFANISYIDTVHIEWEE